MLEPNKPYTPTKSFAEKSNEKIIISRHDMNAALFMGSHYACDFPGNHQTFFSKSIDVTITAPRPLCHLPPNQQQQDYIVRCTLRDIKRNEVVDLDFKQRGPELEFVRGKISDDKGIKPDTPVTSARQLGETLGRIYKTVRCEVDKKWSTDIAMRLEAREIAGQCLNAKMDIMPQFDIVKDSGLTRIHFVPPQNDNANKCQKKCGQCRLKAESRVVW